MLRGGISCGLKLTLDDFTVDSLSKFVTYISDNLPEGSNNNGTVQKLSSIKGGLH